MSMILIISILCGCSNDPFNLANPHNKVTAGSSDDAPSMAAETVMTQAQAPDVFRLAYQKEYGLNPFSTVSLNNRTILSLIYEPLFLVNSRFEPEPVLATSYNVSDDGCTTTVYINSNAKFHNNHRVTSQDVLYSYELAKESDYYGNRFYYFQDVVAIDRYTIAITTSTAYENVAVLLDFPIVRRGTGSYPVPDGSGPYVFVDELNLVRAENWWRTKWVLDYDEAALTPCTTAADIRDHYEYGQVNLVCTDPSSAAYAAFHYDFELWSSPTTIMQYIGFNHTDKIFGLDSVRSCITYAIDRSEIVAQDLGGCASPAVLPASPQSAYYDSVLASNYGYDPETFNRLLEEAEIMDYTGDGVLDIYVEEYSVPMEGTMIVNASSNQRVATAERIAGYLNDAGFSITVKALDEDQYWYALENQNFDMYYGEIRMSSNFDMGSFFRDYGSANYAGSANVDALELSIDMLENSGNSYDLHKWVMDKGWICPVLFKSYAVYTTRGAANDLDPAVDWIIH